MMDVNGLIAEALTESAPTEATESQDISGQQEPQSTEPSETGDATESQEQESPTPAPAAKVDAYQAFRKLASEADLTTPEGVQAVKEAADQLQRELGRSWSGFNKKSAKVKAQAAQLAQEKETYRAAHQQLNAAVNALQVGSAKDVLNALGALTGKDPIKLYDEITVQMATGKRPDPETAAVRKELAELKAALAERDNHQRTAAEQHAEKQAEIQCLTIANDSAKFPLLSGFAKSEPGRTLAAFRETLDEMRASGYRPTSYQEIAEALETQLTERIGSQTGRTPGAQKAKSEPSQRTQPHRSISAATRDAAPATRTKTREEELAALAQDDSFMRSAFGGLF